MIHSDKIGSFRSESLTIGRRAIEADSAGRQEALGCPDFFW